MRVCGSRSSFGAHGRSGAVGRLGNGGNPQGTAGRTQASPSSGIAPSTDPDGAGANGSAGSAGSRSFYGRNGTAEQSLRRLFLHDQRCGRSEAGITGGNVQPSGATGSPSGPGGSTGTEGGGSTSTGASGATGSSDGVGVTGGGGATGTAGSGATGMSGETGATGLVGPALSLALLPDGLKAAGSTGLADNQGNSVSVAFAADGTITGIVTSNRSVVDRDQEGNVTAFGDAVLSFDGNGTPIIGSSALTQGPLPLEAEPTGQVIEFVSDQPQQPLLDGNGRLIGFAEKGFAENDGKAVRVNLDANGDIEGFTIEERRPIGATGMTSVAIRVLDLKGQLLAQAMS